MPAAPLYKTPIAADWIDYNGHLRDAYYGLILSLATDALMDRLGLDASYRERTRCTLYTVEMHIHYLKEVHQSDAVVVNATILGSDTKRIHAALQLWCEGRAEPAATAEVMLLHIEQADPPSTAPFPDPVLRAIEQFRTQWSGPIAGPGSRRMELRSRT